MNKNLLKLVSSLFVALVLLVSSSSFADDVETQKEENTSEENPTSAPSGDKEESCGCKAFSFIAGADLEDQKTSDSSSEESSEKSSSESSDSSSEESSEKSSNTNSTEE